MYNYLTDREKLIEIAGHYRNKHDKFDWTDIAEEANLIFTETKDKHTWRKRYERAFLFLSKLEGGDVQTRKQRNTENHLRYSGTLEGGRVSVLTEEVLRILEQSAIPIKFNNEFNVSKTEDEFVFVTSDFHYDGSEPMLDKIGKVYHEIKRQQKQYGFNRIKLIELGDVVEGSHLRPSQLLAIKKMLIPQTIDIARAYTQLLQKLTEDMFVDFYCVTSSNHTQTRAFGTGRNELVEDDAMLIFAEVVKTAMSKNQNFMMVADKDFLVNITPKHKMFVAHGHLVAGKKSGYIQELAMARGITFDYALFGHFHHYREITIYGRDTHNMKVFYAPSMNDTHSNYELDRNLSSKAGILMMVFNENRGHRYCEELFLNERN